MICRGNERYQTHSDNPSVFNRCVRAHKCAMTTNCASVDTLLSPKWAASKSWWTDFGFVTVNIVDLEAQCGTVEGRKWFDDHIFLEQAVPQEARGKIKRIAQMWNWQKDGNGHACGKQSGENYREKHSSMWWNWNLGAFINIKMHKKSTNDLTQCETTECNMP